MTITIPGGTLDAELYYSEQGDIEAIYGANNVNKWADINNDGNTTDITARILWANKVAYFHINQKLLNGPYTIPFTTVFPVMIVDISARYAGFRLYESRGIDDNLEDEDHMLVQHADRVEQDLRSIMGGTLKPEEYAEGVTYTPIAFSSN